MQYTIRKVPKAVDRAFRAKAKAEGKSLNQLAVEAIAKQAGLDTLPKRPKRDLSFLKMEPEDIAAIREAHELCDQIDPEALAVKLLLDTNRYSDLAAQIVEVEAVVSTADELFLPFIVIAELSVGFRLGTRRIENERKLSRFISTQDVKVLFPDTKTVDLFATLKLQLRRQGTPVPDHDIWIAALCMQHGLTLYARDKHFDHLPQLLKL